MNLLDCTFRDGGYYNNWEFSNSELNQYLEFINNNNIQIIEIGFRFLKKNKFYGPFAFSSDFFLKNLKLLNKKKISVMINAKDYYLDKNLILNNFSLKKNSIIDIVRIAVNYDEFHKCKDLVSVLKKLGYEVGFNLMKANYIDKSLAIKIFKELKSWNNIDVLYFADSLGCMENDDIFQLSNLINLYWGKEFGIHAHNNKGLAISNSLKALECGATWVDTTILGMGRGAGNAPTESLLIELKSKNKIKTINFTDLSLFHSLKNKYKWGYSPFYHYSATYMIHPTYVQTLIEDDRYGNVNIFNTLERLRTLQTTSFNSILLEEDYSKFYNKNYKGYQNSHKQIKTSDLLVIGSGKSTKNFKNHIENFIKLNKFTTLSLNYSREIDPVYIDFFVISHLVRINLEIKEILNKRKKIIAPPAIIEKFNIPKKRSISYGLKISKSYLSSKTYCQTLSPLALSYALLFAAQSKVKKIYLAGIDGYEDQNKNEEINLFLTFFQKKYKNIRVYKITPSKFNSIDSYFIY